MCTTVFISSPVKGLKRMRKAAAQACEEMGLEAILSELSGSSPKSSIEWCIQKAKECDIFILLLGGTYGWIPPKEKISVTEMEFNSAKSSKYKPIFVYRIKSKKIEEKQKKFIQRVENFSSGYFRGKPIEKPSELKKRIKKDITKYLCEYFKTTSIDDKLVCPLCRGKGIISLKNKVIYCSECGVAIYSSGGNEDDTKSV